MISFWRRLMKTRITTLANPTEYFIEYKVFLFWKSCFKYKIKSKSYIDSDDFVPAWLHYGIRSKKEADKCLEAFEKFVEDNK